MEEYPSDAWDKVFRLNVRAVFETSVALLPLLDAGSVAGDPARIINIGSVAGILHQARRNAVALLCVCGSSDGGVSAWLRFRFSYPLLFAPVLVFACSRCRRTLTIVARRR